eukprot:CAMPEP_0181527968 /NCGR_PEP_ID=MMETSP1110-20121109/70291_1 /TAXON_ID=174948 /ORGANISM="Symbiodinium sp., Strain CCMP421" /LENGTH=43 /DNA_ID= /DNA_START= /DNA_END= /DNA_ORIENTATION=
MKRAPIDMSPVFEKPSSASAVETIPMFQRTTKAPSMTCSGEPT